MAMLLAALCQNRINNAQQINAAMSMSKNDLLVRGFSASSLGALTASTAGAGEGRYPYDGDPLASTGHPLRWALMGGRPPVRSFGLGSSEPVESVMRRWDRLLDALAARGVARLATAHQVHGADVVRHATHWRGWLRERGVDGHITDVPGTALAVTIADCTPVFIAHPRGVIAALHAGWRGTAAGILSVGLDAMADLGCPADECRVHLGPSICGACYEVGPEGRLYGRRTDGKGLDVRRAGEKAMRRGRRAELKERCLRLVRCRRSTGSQLRATRINTLSHLDLAQSAS
jgi:hypothetical protein